MFLEVKGRENNNERGKQHVFQRCDRVASRQAVDCCRRVITVAIVHAIRCVKVSTKYKQRMNHFDLMGKVMTI